MKLNETIVKRINPTIYEYIEKNVFSVYAEDDSGHGLDHIFDVINRSFALLDNLGLDLDQNIVFVIASYHDIGRIMDDGKHEKRSAEMFLEDKFMEQYYSDDERKLMSEAIEDHRASIKYEPRSNYGKLVSSADRSHDLIKPLIRTYQYRLNRNSNLSLDEKIRDSYNHLQEKFGEEGYAKNVWYDDGVYKQYLIDFRELIDDYDAFKKAYLKANEIDY
ncbi:MAG: HD domain-containing protein [Bacilli bacterium]|nr:HD domain-containing protein [Bacilli bacterium]MDD3305429.1 HD domain-containing protein [Bacilli bacterium]MDD4054109.1 HD domain-containing protein [Bacilli bacterium]MDD4411896.1 HD domain-containing protein [Bacilli bacterium]